MNKRLENKITRWYGQADDTPRNRIAVRVWLAKHWHRWITYGCSMCWIDTCDCSAKNRSINSPKGFGEIAEYAYDNYGDMYKK